eukprot:UN34832
MEEVAAPIRSDWYTVRTGDGDVIDDATSYIPDTIMDIHIRVTESTKKYIGIMIYAVSADGTILDHTGCESPGCIESETKVGEWLLQENSGFHHNICDTSVATHTNASQKPFHTTLHFVAPAAGTGKIYFRALIKRGPTQMGEFYWPMVNGDLALDEAPGVGISNFQWFTGEANQSCDEVC